jgi:hypothetical protein
MEHKLPWKIGPELKGIGKGTFLIYDTNGGTVTTIAGREYAELIVDSVNRTPPPGSSPRSKGSLAACVVRFCRTQLQKNWETGVAVLPTPVGTADLTLIVDLDGKTVPTVWDYALRPQQGCFTASDVVEFQDDGR